MRWLLRDLLLLALVLLTACLVVMGAVGILLDLEGLRQVSILNLTWGETILVILGIVAVLAVLRVLWRLRSFEANKPEFTVLVLPAGPRLRVMVVNTSPSTFTVTARGIGLDDSFGRVATEPFVIPWEESTDMQFQLNPGDHGTLYIGRYHAVQEGAHERHFVEFQSRREGQRETFPFFDHTELDRVGNMRFILQLFPSIPSSIKKYFWAFRLNHEHPHQRFWLTEQDPLPNWLQRVSRRVSRRFARQDT